MLALQSSIGATNDVADEADDRARGARKPIPAGQVGVPAAVAVAVAGAIVGLVLAAAVHPVLLLTAGVGLACGIAYDLWLRPTGLGTVAFAIALPTLLVHAWWGGSGDLPPGGLTLLLLAALVGPALHLSNALVDLELDRTLLVRLVRRPGQGMAVVVLAVIVGGAHLLAWLLLAGWGPPVGPATAMLAGGILAALGVALSANRERRGRSMGWTCQALGTALLGVGLLAALA